MNFGLLVSQLPHVQESHAHYDAMLVLHAREPRRFVVVWRAIKARISSVVWRVRLTQADSAGGQ
jgi:hypothetical protein